MPNDHARRRSEAGWRSRRSPARSAPSCRASTLAGARRRDDRRHPAALLEHKVVFFRDQTLDYEEQVAFARRFGTLTLGHPTIQSPPDQPLHGRGRLRQGRAGRRLAHRRDLPRSAGVVHVPARHGDSRGRRRHGVGQHGQRVRDALAGAARRWPTALRIIHTNVHPDARIDGGRAESQPGVGRERTAVRVDDLPGRAPDGHACIPRPASARCCSAASRSGSSATRTSCRAR